MGIFVMPFLRISDFEGHLVDSSISKYIWRFFGRGKALLQNQKNFYPEIHPGIKAQYVRNVERKTLKGFTLTRPVK